MDRRGFLRSLLGLAATVALPAKAEWYIAEFEPLSDVAFKAGATCFFDGYIFIQSETNRIFSEQVNDVHSWDCVVLPAADSAGKP